uniref:Two component phosphate response regulator n=1 Tax=uncultured microorganism TaxID=358574 RepID=F8UH52_9ZZZZ|nr:two component phosphate response regulator [uncultured microorganism]
MRKILFFDSGEASRGIVSALAELVGEEDIVSETYSSASRGVASAISEPPSAIVIIDEGKGKMLGDMSVWEVTARLARHMSTSNIPMFKIDEQQLKEIAQAGEDYARQLFDKLHNEKKRMLLVAEDASVRRELCTGLDSFYQVREAETAIGAGTELLKFTPDIALISYALRDDPSGGFMFCESLRSDNRFDALPIIGLGDFPEDKRYCLDAHLKQPFTLEEVHNTIDSLLKKE